jgi:hypothetical protein
MVIETPESLDRTPPNDIAAERAVLGCCMNNPKLVEQIRLVGADFYRSVHETIWNAIRELTARGVPSDWVAVNAILAEQGNLPRVGGTPYLHDLVSETTVTVNVDYYAAIIQDRSGRRKMIDEMVRGLQDAYGSADPLEAILGRAEARLSSVPSRDDSDLDALMNLDEFLAQPIPADDWVIPDLMARGDRLVLTGLEGLGKSILMRQIAMCAAAGIHPFNGMACEPKTVLFIDAENPKVIMMKTIGQLRHAVSVHGFTIDAKRWWIERRPQGLDLSDAKDRLWLQRRVQLVQPDLLCIGPAYKLYLGGQGEREEDLARQVTSALDVVREMVGCALILEHHSPHSPPGVKTRNVRPIGSSLWLRWPEFGLGIRHADRPDAYDRRLVDVVPWRGSRDERPWPDQLESPGNGMPWVEVFNK